MMTIQLFIKRFVKLGQRLKIRFTSLDKLDSKTKKTVIVYPDKMPPISTFELAKTPLIPVPATKSLAKSSYQPPSIKATVLSNAIYCARHGVLLDKNRSVFKESMSTNFKKSLLNSNILFSKDEQFIPGISSTISSRHNGFYHFTIDNLPRLFILDQDEFSAYDQINLLFGRPQKPREQYFLDRLLPPHVKTVFPEKDLIRAEEFILPHFISSKSAGYWPSEVLSWFLGQIAPKRPRKITNRIFISRTSEGAPRGRQIINEAELLAALEPYGFKAYQLEKMPISDQINLFYDAEFIIAPHGAGLANLIYTKSAKVIELFPNQFMVPHFYFLSKSVQAAYRFLLGKETPRNRNANFRVDIPAVISLVQSFDS
jgi:hypothetical protein